MQTTTTTKMQNNNGKNVINNNNNDIINNKNINETNDSYTYLVNWPYALTVFYINSYLMLFIYNPWEPRSFHFFNILLTSKYWEEYDENLKLAYDYVTGSGVIIIIIIYILIKLDQIKL